MQDRSSGGSESDLCVVRFVKTEWERESRRQFGSLRYYCGKVCVEPEFLRKPLTIPRFCAGSLEALEPAQHFTGKASNSSVQAISAAPAVEAGVLLEQNCPNQSPVG